MPSTETINQLTALGAIPADDDKIPLWDTSASGTKSVLFQYLKTFSGSTITSSSSIALTPNLFLAYTDTTDRATTLTGAPVFGWLIVIGAQAVSGGTGHSALLPSGITFDGTNRKVVLNANTDVLIAMATSATRYLILYNNGCTFAAS